MPPKEIQGPRELIRLRTYLVRERTKFKNKIMGELEKRGIHVPGDPITKRGRSQLGKLKINAIDDCLAVIALLDGQIRELDKELKESVQENEDAKLLMSIPGVGYFSAQAILAEIGDISRFSDPEKLCSYVGLVPSLHQSGETRKLGGVTKQGSSFLRWILVECAWMHVNHAKGTRLTRFFWKIAKRKGRKIAIVATARKLLTTMYWMLKRREGFRA